VRRRSGGFADYPKRLERLRAEGFRLVSLVPTWQRVENAVALSLSSGAAVVLKPHLDPGASIWGYVPPDPALTRGWRWSCGWRGYFDVDPMSEDYCEGLVGGPRRAQRRALAARPPLRRLRLGRRRLGQSRRASGRLRIS